MKLLRNLTTIILLSLLTACGTTMYGDREPEPEIYTSADDFYNSLWAELEYTPDQKKIVEYGRTLLGKRYNYGGDSRQEGFDCSGFTRYVYKNALNKSLPRTAKEMASSGISVTQDKLVAGDLVFFNTMGFDYSHVGIYIGNNRFIHASTAKHAIVIGNIKNEYFAKRYNGARRILATN